MKREPNNKRQKYVEIIKHFLRYKISYSYCVVNNRLVNTPDKLQQLCWAVTILVSLTFNAKAFACKSFRVAVSVTVKEKAVREGDVGLVST